MTKSQNDAAPGARLLAGVILRDKYVQADAPDPVLDEAAVLDVARRHAPGATGPVSVDESGGEARAYLLTSDAGDLVFKTQRPHRLRTRTSLAKEALFLRHLAALPRDPVPVPRVLGHGSADLPAGERGASVRIEYTLMSRIAGDAVQRVRIEGATRRDALLELGGVLRRMHEAPQQPLLESGLFPGDARPGDLAMRLEAPALGAARKLEGTARGAMLGIPPGALVARLIAALPGGGPRVALHANPGPVHTFVDPSTGAFAGLIDFGDAYVSHPALDLRRWDRHEDRVTLLDGYRRGRGVDDAFERVWRVACALAELTALAGLPEVAPREEAERRAATVTSLIEELGS